MESKTGKVAVVSKNGGIKFEGEDVWYNAAEQAKKFVRFDMKGKEVSIKLVPDQERTFNYIGPAGTLKTETPTGEPVEGKSEYWKAKEERDIVRDLRISRQGALNTALVLIGLAVQAGATSFNAGDKTKGYTTTNLRQLAETEAEQILLFINKGGEAKK